MPFPGPRLRLRTLLIAVAVAGTALGIGSVLWRRSRSRELWVRYHRQRVYEIARRVPLDGPPRTPEEDAAVERETARIQFHRAMIQKYREAAPRPWLPVAPDPPPPE